MTDAKLKLFSLKKYATFNVALLLKVFILFQWQLIVGNLFIFIYQLNLHHKN